MGESTVLNREILPQSGFPFFLWIIVRSYSLKGHYNKSMFVQVPFFHFWIQIQMAILTSPTPSHRHPPKKKLFCMRARSTLIVGFDIRMLLKLWEASNVERTKQDFEATAVNWEGSFAVLDVNKSVWGGTFEGEDHFSMATNCHNLWLYIRNCCR